ncbi:hypothetical protein ISU10_01745 [Nocardioides agariphilus]|uniref:Uncharacterized protein n=1 Tax=Nocardioides agariphilus TaxID=433664 RepID=A0A930VH46_9ACTN|nr:hypothetical protein [Nocardioides agariphilus]MBF4766487.1 hypothetical protein [Nocardioides agariphilus]
MPAHALLECYSVLTRLPGPSRIDGRTVAASLERPGLVAHQRAPASYDAVGVAYALV